MWPNTLSMKPCAAPEPAPQPPRLGWPSTSTAGRGWRYVLAQYALARRAQARIGRGGLVLRSCAHPPLVSVAVKTYPRDERDEASLPERQPELGVLRRLRVSGRRASRMVSNFTSACCTSRLARGNAQGQTHSETSSNYLCTNDKVRWSTARRAGPRPARGPGRLQRGSTRPGRVGPADIHARR